MKRLVLILALAALCSCSQKGEVEVDNESGSDLEVEIDGVSFVLDDGGYVIREIDIGSKFIFGPDEKDVRVWGEGTCKWAFSRGVTVRSDELTTVTVHGDAGYLQVCNSTLGTLALYISPCYETSWGDPDDYISSGSCSIWKLQVGCWDMKVSDGVGSYEDYDIIVMPCDLYDYTIVSAKMTAGDAQIKLLQRDVDFPDHGDLKKEKSARDE